MSASVEQPVGRVIEMASLWSTHFLTLIREPFEYVSQPSLSRDQNGTSCLARGRTGSMWNSGLNRTVVVVSRIFVAISKYVQWSQSNQLLARHLKQLQRDHNCDFAA